MKKRLLFLHILFITITLLVAQTHEPLQRLLSLPRQKSTVYELLNTIGELSGYSFIYDSKVADNERKVKLPAGTYTLRDAIYRILGNTNYTLSVVDRYILIDKKRVNSASPPTVPVQLRPDSITIINISGTVTDKINNQPISDCTLGIDGTSIGTIANADGRFTLKIPLKYKDATLHISHLGYEARQIPVAFFAENSRTIYMNQRIVPLQEVIVRMVNPRKIVQEAVESRSKNYPSEPSYLTSFYREGIEKRKDLLYLSEAVFKVFKPSYESNSEGQIKLLKMRKITNEVNKDTVILKMKAGPEASLLIDLIKNVPDFMDINDNTPFNYTKIDMVEYDSHLAHVVTFEPKAEVTEPMYRGRLYIDASNAALLRAEFEIDPRHIDKATSLFIIKRGRDVQIKPQQIYYSVAYKLWNGKYYISHLRGDLFFKMKQKRQLFYSPTHIFFESATCKIDTLEVKPFPKTERVPLSKIFAETQYTYDNAFWGDFNTILPQEKLNEAIEKISAKVEASADGD
ncbi:MAG: putative outer membrane protein involved in nutrient binding [Bacteroidetes bacterium]|nr:putative outer membrane protein involved in nutrient binding [Bacteroidota bacterium]